MQRITLEQVKSFEQFYRLPKIFFTSDKYKDMKLESKTAYAILRDRFELSISNGWVDDEQNVYFVYTVASLEELLGCGNKKVIAIKRDLAAHGLLEEVRQGLNKPNRLYLGLAIAENDQEKRPEALVQAEVSNGHFQNGGNDTSGSVKTTLQEMSKRHPNDTNNNHTEFNETDISVKEDDGDELNIYKPAKPVSDVDLLAQQYDEDTPSKITGVKKRKLEQLANLYGAVLVSEAITKAGENDSGNLTYIERCAISMDQEMKSRFSDSHMQPWNSGNIGE